ncbi:transglycosylase SLT domain-containing protein [Streptomyces sp. NPDC021100]|uniref:transglycosylase SLT domain-containing protein n=1 Tax=Streptomyces sp. NPDC021100 TaxID=3365114 RepID=UPI00379EA370
MRSTHSGYTRLTKAHKFSAAALTAAGAAALAFGAASHAEAAPAPVKPVAWNAKSLAQTQGAERADAADKAAEQAKADAAAKVKADKERAAKQAANRSTAREPLRKPVEKPAAAPAAPAPKAYGNDLEGWISQALDIMKAKGIPASYDGVKRNIMRESTGNPRAINDWDVNAVNGVPSKGLLQIIDPTFKAYHVEGTSWDIYDPVANIVASCNYAADKYGSMDNVNSAY